MRNEPQLTNWAGNHVYTTSGVRRPGTIDELATIVAASDEVRPVGSRHSFTQIADAEVLVDLSDVGGVATVADDRSAVTVPGHWTFARVAAMLDEHGLALHNLASLPHISVAGAVATGTHGSGDGNTNLSEAVIAVDLMTATGDVLTLDHSDDRFAGVVVSMGALGIMTKVTLRVEPTFDARQDVFEAVDSRLLTDSFGEIFGAGYSVSAFTRWIGPVEQIWLKRRLDRDGPIPSIFDGIRASSEERHPIISLDPAGCTPQLGVPGPWHERLPHFRMGFEPSAGDEIQSEFFVPRVEAGPAIEALQRIGHELAEVLLVSEIRTIAGDDMWMSPHHECDSVAFHFTWRRDPAAVASAVQVVEAALAPFAPRPHWGKVFTIETFDADELYRCFDDFVALLSDLDPAGKFSNAWTRQILRN